MSTAEPVHVCLGCDPCPECAAEEAFWRDCEYREHVAHGIEALEYHEAQQREAS